VDAVEENGVEEQENGVAAAVAIQDVDKFLIIRYND
jgi:hypothetical protein